MDPDDRATDVDVPAPEIELGGGAGKRRRARSRTSVAAGWEWLPSRSIRVRKRGRCFGTGEPYDLKITIPWQGSVEATEAAAMKAVAVQRAEALAYESGQKKPQESLSLAQWRERALKSHVLAAWSSADRSTWTLLRPLWGIDLRHLDRARLASWVRSLQGEGYSVSYQRRAWALLSKLVGLAVTRRVIASAPWGPKAPAELPPASQEGQRRALEPHEVEAIAHAVREIDASTGGDLALRIETMLQVAARPIEVCMLTPDDVSTTGGRPSLRMRVMKQHGSQVKWIHRPIPLSLANRLLVRFSGLPDPARAVGVLFPVRENRGRWAARFAERVIGVGRVERKSELVSPAEILAIRQRSGVRDFVLYLLRHTRLTGVGAAVRSFMELVAFSGHSPRSRAVGGYMHAAAVELPAEISDGVFPSSPGTIEVIDVTATERSVASTVVRGRGVARLHSESPQSIAAAVVGALSETRGREDRPSAQSDDGGSGKTVGALEAHASETRGREDRPTAQSDDGGSGKTVGAGRAVRVKRGKRPAREVVGAETRGRVVGAGPRLLRPSPRSLDDLAGSWVSRPGLARVEPTGVGILAPEIEEKAKRFAHVGCETGFLSRENPREGSTDEDPTEKESKK